MCALKFDVRICESAMHTRLYYYIPICNRRGLAKQILNNFLKLNGCDELWLHTRQLDQLEMDTIIKICGFERYKLQKYNKKNEELRVASFLVKGILTNYMKFPSNTPQLILVYSQRRRKKNILETFTENRTRNCNKMMSNVHLTHTHTHTKTCYIIISNSMILINVGSSFCYKLRKKEDDLHFHTVSLSTVRCNEC